MSAGTNTGLLDIHLTQDDAEAALRADVRTGLAAPFKHLPPKWFYDARGSALFEEITELPEYYPTRTERALLAESVDAIAAASGADTLVELGSGSSEKTRLLLDAFTRAGALRRYVPQDVSAPALRQAMDALAVDYPDLELHGVVGDFTMHLDRLPGGAQRMVAFLGGTIGNLRPHERRVFLDQLRAVLQPGEQLLLGTTAEFNRNVLHVLNRELDADFDVDAFAHVALWDPVDEWIEMRLRATRAMTVHVRALDLVAEFAEGEEMRTEISAKFHVAGVRQMLQASAFAPVQTWTDPDERFALTLAAAVEGDEQIIE
jgi:L-histidine N-alpha-methyltransferase